MSWSQKAIIPLSSGRDIMDTHLVNIVSHFTEPAGLINIEKFGSGHIHDTFLARFEEPKPSLVLQRINQSIFKNIEGLMRNIRVVTDFIDREIKTYPAKYHFLKPLVLVPASDGRDYYSTGEAGSWRCFFLIPDTISYDIPPQKNLVSESGKMLGRFQAILSKLDPMDLVETIPAFHDLQKRLDTFHETVIHDPAGRVKDCKPEILFVMQKAGELLKLDSLVKSGTIPMRIAHNDPKFNNFLFDRDNRAVCLIDLDTVMPGTVLFDFGDAIRTATNTAAEDEINSSKVSFDYEAYRYFTGGYLEEANGFLTKEENENLALSCRYMTFIIGLRFLTDHLDGDHYYRIRYEGHNLVRAKVQFALVQSMEEHRLEMEEACGSGSSKR